MLTHTITARWGRSILRGLGLCHYDSDVCLTNKICVKCSHSALSRRGWNDCRFRSEFDVLFRSQLKRPLYHINQSAGLLHLTYSIIPKVLALPQKIYLGVGYICGTTFSPMQRLTSVNYLSPESNTFSQCQAISVGLLNGAGRIKTVL